MNRQHQLKIALLENNTNRIGRNSSTAANYFLLLQEKMEKLMNFLISEGYIKNNDRYIEFTSRYSIYLMKINDS